jgi:hypothetical protein
MEKTHLLFLCLGLGACSTVSVPSTPWANATFTGTLPQPAEPAEEGAPETTTLPVGVGLTTGPGSMLLGAALDFPIDKMITFGPAIQVGMDDSANLTFVTGQLKYYLSIGDDGKKKPTLLPYLTAGVGVASVDKDGRSGDSGAVINIGAGLRMLTGDNYRIGSEARLNYLPDELGGEDVIMSFELLQVVISF